MKKLIACFLAIFACTGVYAQDMTLKEYVQQGVELHDKGDYKAAIENYRKALQLEPRSPLANFEIASSYFSLKDYKQALSHIEIVLQSKTNFADQAYMLKGSILDMQGKPDEAIAVYKTALQSYKDNYLLYYNLALTLFNNKGGIDQITDALEHALLLNPNHASSHLLMGYTMKSQGKRVQSLLALYYFMMLEPKSNRSESALNAIQEALRGGVEQKDDKTFTVYVPMNHDEDEFNAAETMISLLAASKTLEENKDKSEHELFLKNTELIFSVLGELKKERKTFWWDFYVRFFVAMNDAKHTPTFCNYIWMSKNNVKVNQWLEVNTAKINRFSKWYEGYKH